MTEVNEIKPNESEVDPIGHILDPIGLILRGEQNPKNPSKKGVIPWLMHAGAGPDDVLLPNPHFIDAVDPDVAHRVLHSHSDTKPIEPINDENYRRDISPEARMYLDDISGYFDRYRKALIDFHGIRLPVDVVVNDMSLRDFLNYVTKKIQNNRELGIIMSAVHEHVRHMERLQEQLLAEYEGQDMLRERTAAPRHTTKKGRI